MAASLCLLRNPLPWIAVLVPLLIFTGLLGFGSLSILFTSSVLIISTIYFTITKQKPLLVEDSEKREVLSSDQESLPHMEEVESGLQLENESITQKKEGEEGAMNQIKDYMEEVATKLQLECETVTEKKEVQEVGMSQIHNFLVRSPDSLSESESLDHSSTSEDSEVDWLFQDNVAQGSACSDGSISDEDSLIEIALPSGHYVSPKEEEPKFNLQKKLTDFSPESMFQQHSLKDLFLEINEMNEEENLIEIDISMGSIKYSRFEIEA